MGPLHYDANADTNGVNRKVHQSRAQSILCEGYYVFPVGHLALGYLLGKAMSKSLNVSLRIPLVLVASIISDIDLVIPGLQHRGPTHSLALIILLSLPAFVLYRKKAAPYFVASFQHSIVGDFITGDGVQALWPLAPSWYWIGIEQRSLINFSIEWILFLASMTIMFKTKDVMILFQHHASNIFLSIPLLATLLSTLPSLSHSIPLELVIPHLVYLILFALSIFADFRCILRRSIR